MCKCTRFVKPCQSMLGSGAGQCFHVYIYKEKCCGDPTEADLEPDLNWNDIFDPQMSFTQSHSSTQMSFQLHILKNGAPSQAVTSPWHFSLHKYGQMGKCQCTASTKQR